MRPSAAVRVSVERFARWRVALAVWAALGVTSLAAWVWSHHAVGGLDPLASVLMAMLAAAGALGLGLCARSLYRLPPLTLDWDRRCWHLGRPDRPHQAAQAGDVEVALDLGGWMLLRFAPHDRGRARWIPLQRRGLEAHWHALRCAVHSPHPARDAAAQPRLGDTP